MLVKLLKVKLLKVKLKVKHMQRYHYDNHLPDDICFGNAMSCL